MSSTQGHMIHSSKRNQEETLKPPILCEGNVADGLQEFSCSSCIRRSFPAWDVQASLCTTDSFISHINCILWRQRSSRDEARLASTVTADFDEVLTKMLLLLFIFQKLTDKKTLFGKSYIHV